MKMYIIIMHFGYLQWSRCDYKTHAGSLQICSLASFRIYAALIRGKCAELCRRNNEMGCDAIPRRCLMTIDRAALAVLQ